MNTNWVLIYLETHSFYSISFLEDIPNNELLSQMCTAPKSILYEVLHSDAYFAAYLRHTITDSMYLTKGFLVILTEYTYTDSKQILQAVLHPHL